MQENDKPVLVYSTFPGEDAAVEIGTALIDHGLAACVNIIPGMTSIYNWEGNRQREREVVMLIKTRAGLSGRVVGEVRARHPYANPALLVLPVEGGSEPFLSWILECTRSPAP